MGQLVLFHLCLLFRLPLQHFFYPELKHNRSYTLLDMAPPVLHHLMDPQKKKHPETAPELDWRLILYELWYYAVILLLRFAI